MGPRCRSMLLDVCAGNPVRDPLVAERRKKPVEDRRRMAKGDSRIHASLEGFGVDLVEKGHRPRQSADGSNKNAGALKLVGGWPRKDGTFFGAFALKSCGGRMGS